MKKTHKKLKVLLILFTILLPTIILIAFYPRLERVANKEIEKNTGEELYTEYVYGIDTEFMLDCQEHMSYMYSTYHYEKGDISLENYSEQVKKIKNDLISDKEKSVSYVCKIEDDSKYYIYPHSVQAENYSIDVMAHKILEEGYILNYEDMQFMNIAAYYCVEYDEYGLRYRNDFYTYEQTENHNISWEDVSVEGTAPENMKAVYFLPYSSNYVTKMLETYYDDWYSYEEAYYDIGTPILIVVAAMFVALMALVLSSIKSLNIGNEKAFRISGEITIILLGCVIAAMCGMFFTMAGTNKTFWLSELGDNNDYILGYEINAELVYAVLIALNALAWAICFFVEFVVVVSLRQFIAHPIKYVKERFILSKIFGFAKKNTIKLLDKSKEIVASFDENKKLLIVLGINLIVGVVASGFWVEGMFLFLVYTIVAYILVYKKWMQAKKQFEIIKDTVHKMAEGKFDVHIDEDMGIFQPISDEIVKVRDGFEKALIEEAKSRDMKTELITNVSHDLKTPLTAIITYVDLLKKEDITEEERQQYIATLDMKSQRLKVLIEDLFEVSKANSGNVQMNPMDVDVVGLLKQVRLELEDKISESNVDFRWNLPDEKVILKLDGQKTYRIFANLINNITKYSLSGSRAFVGVNADENKVVITFKNISATEINCDVENLTERFVRGDASRNSEGSGLGLAIVKSFVELQGGTFRINVDGDLFKAVIEWSK